MAFWQLEGFPWHFQLPQPKFPKPRIELKCFSKGKKEEIFFDFVFPMTFSTTKT